MIAVGAGSIFCSFFGCLPLTASFSRSSVMSASGGKTQFANFFNGETEIPHSVSLFQISSFSFALCRLCDIDCPEPFDANFLLHSKIRSGCCHYSRCLLHGRVGWNSSHVERKKYVFYFIFMLFLRPPTTFHMLFFVLGIELIPFGTTFFFCLLINIEYGILIGALVHLLLLAHEATRTKSSYVRYKVRNLKYVAFLYWTPDIPLYFLKQKQGVGERIILRADRNLYFPSVERFRQELGKISSESIDDATPKTIIIDMSHVSEIDHTSLKVN